MVERGAARGEQPEGRRAALPSGGRGHLGRPYLSLCSPDTLLSPPLCLSLRYAYRNQPEIGLSNCVMLAQVGGWGEGSREGT